MEDEGQIEEQPTGLEIEVGSGPDDDERRADPSFPTSCRFFR